MGPIALAAYLRGERGLARAQHYFVSEKIVTYAIKMMGPLIDSHRFVMELALPASEIVFETANLAVFLTDEGNDVFAFTIGKDGRVHPTAILKKREATYILPAGHEKVAETLWGNAVIAAFLVDLLNEPRLIEVRPPARPHRRRLGMVVGDTVATRWKEMVFTIGKPRSAQQGQKFGSYRQALSYRVAHWARHIEGKPAAERRPGRDGWWVWRRSAFTGHPDYGVVNRVVVPCLPDDAPERIRRDVDARHRAAAAVASADQKIKAWQAEKLERHGMTVVFDKKVVAG